MFKNDVVFSNGAQISFPFSELQTFRAYFFRNFVFTSEKRRQFPWSVCTGLAGLLDMFCLKIAIAAIVFFGGRWRLALCYLLIPNELTTVGSIEYSVFV